MGYDDYGDYGVMHARNGHRREQPKAVWHFIRRWDEATRRYVCDCGHRAETATDHELHAKADQREAAHEARELAWREGAL